MSEERFQPKGPHPDRDALISRMLDGDLLPDEAEELRSRLASDEGFRRRADEWTRVDEMLREWGATQPEVNWDRFNTSVMREVRRDRTIKAHPADDVRDGRGVGRWRSAGLLLRIAGPLAAAAVLVVAVGLPLRQAQQMRHESRQWVRVDVARPVGLAQAGAPGGKGSKLVHVQYARGPAESTAESASPRVLIISAIARVEERVKSDAAHDSGVF